MTFPEDFPMQPPELTFVSEFFHPNVYANTGAVCISILHPPGEDEMSGEDSSERWLPTRTVPSIVLSVISLLSAPNFDSPANIEASVEWRDSPEQYSAKIKTLVERAQSQVPDHVVIPHPDTDAAERSAAAERIRAQQMQFDESELLASDSVDDDALDFLVGSDESFHESDIEDNQSHTSEDDDDDASTQTGSPGRSKERGAGGKKSAAKSKNKKKPSSASKSHGKAETRSTREPARERRKKSKCSVM
jgi:ubiquitin-conjugating enzyme E2 R